MVIPWSTIFTTVVGIAISVFTGYLSLKVKQLDQKNQAYRKEREEKERTEAEKQRIREESISALSLGMARSMLLENYYKASERGFYPIQDREVYHELFVAYEQAGGDGILHTLAEKIVELPTDDPNKKS